MKTKTVTGIVVTYNRKEALARCLEALFQQTQKITQILVIDNASTDGTLDYLEDKFEFVLTHPLVADHLVEAFSRKGTKVYLYRNSENGGGSLGFHMGMKIAHTQFKSDLYWMMDDDGYPDSKCLDQLMAVSDQYDYIMPTSIDITDHQRLSWPVRKRSGKKTTSYSELQSDWGNIMDYVTPFNGILLSQRCLEVVGYINKDFFIWGDEYDHYWRCVKQGIQPVTLLSAKFYHPAQKLPLVKICFGLMTAPYVDSELRMVCLARNYTYIYNHYGQGYKIPLKFLQYSWLFLITRHGDFAGWKRYIQSVADGLRGDFTRHKQYLK